MFFAVFSIAVDCVRRVKCIEKNSEEKEKLCSHMPAFVVVVPGC